MSDNEALRELLIKKFFRDDTAYLSTAKGIVILPRFCGRQDKRETAARMNHHDHSNTTADHQDQAA